MNSWTDRVGLRNWLFQGLAVEQVLDNLEREGLAVRAATDAGALQRVLPLENFSPSIRKSAIDALPAYLAFFCLENSARELVAERLLENHGQDWWKECASAGVRQKVDKRRSEEGQRRWHVARAAADINYTDFGDLKDIIQGNWVDFQDLFPDQNWVLSRLGELEASRNIIAHGNVLDEREMTRIKLYLQDWNRQVG